MLQDLWAEFYESVHRDTDLVSRDVAIRDEVASFLVELSQTFARREADTIEGWRAMEQLVDVFGRHMPALTTLAWSRPPNLRRYDR